MKDPYGAGWTTSKDIASCCFQKLRVGFVRYFVMVRIKGRRADAFFFFAISWILFRTEEYVSGSLFFGLGMMDRSVCETHLQEQFDPK